MNKMDWYTRLRDAGIAISIGVVILLVVSTFWTQLGTEWGPAIGCIGFSAIVAGLSVLVAGGKAAPRGSGQSRKISGQPGLPDPLWTLTCRHCGERYVIGHDAGIVTDEDVLAFFSTAGAASVTYVGQPKRKPDLVQHWSEAPTDKNEKERQRRKLIQIRTAIAQGEPRSWYCEKCRNESDPNPYPLEELSMLPMERVHTLILAYHEHEPHLSQRDLVGHVLEFFFLANPKCYEYLKQNLDFFDRHPVNATLWTIHDTDFTNAAMKRVVDKYPDDSFFAQFLAASDDSGTRDIAIFTIFTPLAGRRRARLVMSERVSLVPV